MHNRALLPASRALASIDTRRQKWRVAYGAGEAKRYSRTAVVLPKDTRV
jgi:hypothetical protein